ncbi:MAG: putative glycosyltransferase protein [Polyangiaceae bacterium]|jgi:glycosyltransferase involved in cell wall biosynthesis|nr:putative glycosyltransferase protein [Polyangiaceae bacterium]
MWATARHLRLRSAVMDRLDPEASDDAVGLVSVVIPNFNYARYVGQAIDSALALDWPAVEVIVVDDGSTDDSRQVIERYRERVTIVHQSNGGQIAACNAGFARARGNAIVFLDSDDLLHPSVIREAAAVWRRGLSKVQFQMRVIDAGGQPTGSFLPQFQVVPSSDDVKQWVRTAASYPTPPGSGNVYSRRYLEKIFPLSGEDRAADSYCLAAAPHLGDVVTVAKPLVDYRVHGSNDGAMAELDARRFAKELKRAQARFRYADSLRGGAFLPKSPAVLDRSLAVLPYRLASLKLLPSEHPIERDSSWKVLRDLTIACCTPQGVSRRARAALCVWSISVALAPRPIDGRIALWRFSSSSRPELLKRALRALDVVKAA